MKNRKKIWRWIGIILFIFFVGFVVLLYKLYKDLKELDVAMEPIVYSKALNFEAMDHPIFIKTRMWGLLGGHSRIFVTDSDSDRPNEETDVVFFDEYEIYYKIVNPDSLVIFTSSTEKTTRRNIGEIKIQINKFKASQNKKYAEDYNEMGLSKISAYGEFE